MTEKEVAKIAEQSFPPELGGGKERSEFYESHFCQTAEDIDRTLNQDAYAYTYKYITPHGKGTMIILCKPNPKSFLQKYAKRVEHGLEVLGENDATQQTKDLFPYDKDSTPLRLDIELIIARLYDNGYKIVKQVDREVKPWRKFS